MKDKMKQPKDVAAMIGISVQDLVDIGVDRLSSDSLNKLAKGNLKKYELQILGVTCMRLNISVEELVLYSKQREAFMELLEKRQNSVKDIKK